MFRQPEWCSVECAGGVEDGVSVEESPVADGNPNQRFGFYFTVEENYGFGLNHFNYLKISMLVVLAIVFINKLFSKRI